MHITLADIAVCLGHDPAALPAPARDFCPTGAAIDSRKVQPGHLFFCLPGTQVDGHDFARQAAAAGAAALVASRDPFPGEASPVPLFLVADSVEALGMVAALHRDSASATVIGLTGTAGKTSVKEALAAVLAGKGAMAKNPLNLNNQIGLPLSMLNAAWDAAYWVMEAGISEAHDMDDLGRILRPDLALVLNAGAGHLQGLGDRGVAFHKARLLHYLAEGGTALISADYPDLVREAAVYARPTRQFSVREGAAAYTARYLGPLECGFGEYDVVTPAERAIVSAPFQGPFGAENVAAVAAVTHILSISLEDTARGLASASAPAQRFCSKQIGNCLLIDDSYNANPLSMSRMVESASGLALHRKEPLLLVLGEMLELGPETEAIHTRLGREIAETRPKAVIWKGGCAEVVRKGLHQAGYSGPFYPVAGDEEFRGALKASGFVKGVALFKGSRGNRLETLVAIFTTCMGSEGEGDAL